MPRTPSRPVRLLVEGTKATVVAVVSFLAVAPVLATQHVNDGPRSEGSVAGALEAQQAVVERLMAEHECSASGFGPDVIPGSALVERDNRVQHVSFDDGWAAYTGAATGTLLAVCRVDV